MRRKCPAVRGGAFVEPWDRPEPVVSELARVKPTPYTLKRERWVIHIASLLRPQAPRCPPAISNKEASGLNGLVFIKKEKNETFSPLDFRSILEPEKTS